MLHTLLSHEDMHRSYTFTGEILLMGWQNHPTLSTRCEAAQGRCELPSMPHTTMARHGWTGSTVHLLCLFETIPGSGLKAAWRGSARLPFTLQVVPEELRHEFWHLQGDQ